jgi:hypothetical protein
MAARCSIEDHLTLHRRLSLRLRGLFDLQPAGEGVAKLVLQVDNLRLHYRIGMTRLQERLKDVVDHFEVKLA